MFGETQPLLQGASASIPKAPWTAAVQSTRNPKRTLPQTIAHRGYKASFPENTMSAFKGAVEVGAHALETDLHLSQDGVVVLSHDPSLKRCFGVDKKIAECTWEYLSGLKTVQEPRQGLPRLRDLLEWLSEPGKKDIWVLLDVKVDDDADELLGAVARTFEDVPAKKPWNERTVLGLWNATFIKAARRLLPSYPMAFIAFHLPYASHFFEIPNLGFNLLVKSLYGPCGTRFMRKARDAGRPVFAWTVNEERWMEWCIRKNANDGKGGEKGADLNDRLIDGVITDDPRLFLEVCERWEDEQDELVSRGDRGPFGRGVVSSLGAVTQVLTFAAFVRIFFLYGWWKGKFDYFKNVKTLE